MPDKPAHNLRVLLTGGSGFIGRQLLHTLHDAGHLCAGVVRSEQAARRLPGYTEPVRLRIDDTQDWQRLFQQRKFDRIVLCAGTVRGNGSEAFETANVTAVAAVAEALGQLPQAPPVLLFSSLAATAPALSPYAESKARGENALTGSDLPWTIFQPPAVYGPGDQELRALFRLLRVGFLPRLGPADQRLPFIHVTDLAEAALAWVHGSGKCHQQRFRLHDGHAGGYSWEELAVAVGGRPPRLQLPIPAAVLNHLAGANAWLARHLHYAPMLTPGKVQELRHRGWVCDNAPFTERTGWVPRINLSAGVADWFAGPAVRTLTHS